MGLPEWKGGTKSWLLQFIVWLSVVVLTFANDLSNGCNTQPCWDMYEKANSYYQVDSRKCDVLRTYKRCLEQLQTTACISSLDYQGSLQAVKKEFRDNQCTEEGPIYPEGPEPKIREPVTPCKFKGRSIYNYCSLFGDPHLVTFNGLHMTCKLEGAWPLVDNKFFTVQVTNVPLATSTKAATVTQKVTVVVKGMGEDTRSGDFCGSRDAVFYHADIGSLPATFSDGLKEHGEYKSIEVKMRSPGEKVEIYLRYIDSTVIIRQIDSQYLSVGIRMPEQVLNGTINSPDSRTLRQLCVDTCPTSEKVNVGEYMAGVSAGTKQQQMAYMAAQKSCKKLGITDYFFDSCVFDIIMTGEEQFSSMAVNAYEDVRRYASRQPRWTNRTSVTQYIKSTDSSSVSTSSNTASSLQFCNNSLVRTLLFVYIMHIVLVTVLAV